MVEIFQCKKTEAKLGGKMEGIYFACNFRLCNSCFLWQCAFLNLYSEMKLKICKGLLMYVINGLKPHESILTSF